MLYTLKTKSVAGPTVAQAKKVYGEICQDFNKGFKIKRYERTGTDLSIQIGTKGGTALTQEMFIERLGAVDAPEPKPAKRKYTKRKS